MKAKVGHWYEKPPKIVQNIGDALNAGAVFILGYVSLGDGNGLKWLAVTGIFMGALGIVIQKIFKE